MADENQSPDPNAPIEVDLKNPGLAVFLAWLWPGGGHLYQGRYGKGILYMVCILGTFFAGLAFGGGRVVYASWTPEDRRLPYLCQVWVGVPALPALVQNRLARNGKGPLFGCEIMAPPKDVDRKNQEKMDQLSQWHAKYGFRFEMGTLYTMVAGLLNILAMYDAGAGPGYSSSKKDSDKKTPETEKDE